MNENWYLILDLDFDPPVEDQAVIDQIIEEKRKFWATNFNDSFRGSLYKEYHGKLNEIKRIMSDPVERKKQAEAARNDVYDLLNKDLTNLGRGSGEIAEDIVEKYAIKKKVSVDIVKKRMAALGIKIGQKNVDFEKFYEEYYKTKPHGAKIYEGMKTYLQPFNKDNFYDFLNPGTTIMNTLPCDKLTQFAQEMKKKDFYKNNNTSSAGKKICETCVQAFKDENSKRIYDEYLAWGKRRSVLDYVKEIAKVAGSELSDKQGDVFIDQLTELTIDRTLAKNVFISFCKVENIAYNHNPANENNVNIKVCSCGRINDVSDGRTQCFNCKKDLVIKCPKCSTENDANIKWCKCGFELENIDRALALCNLAQQYIKSMEFKTAETHLKDAEKYWPGSSEVKAKREELEEFKQRIGDTAENMRKAVQEKRYYEAKKQYADILKRFPEFKEADLEAEITTAIETAKSYYDKAKAQSATNEKEIIENCTKAHESCCDYPGIRELILRYPPQMVTNLRISTDGNTKTNVLSWNESTSEGTVYYSIVRKRDAIPINNTDGDLVARVNVCSINDSKILPGVGYYYAIFAERAGVYSKPLSTRKPDVNLFEITNVTITPGDAMLQLEWDSIPSGSTVELFRITDGGKEERINSNNSEGFLDSGLKNDENYNYRLRLVYNINGQKQMTNGINISGMPTKPPKAIEILSVKPVQDNTFQATWENPDNSEVRLYYSTNKPDYKCGEIVSQAILESKMRRLAVTKTERNTGTFQFKDDGRLYITAVVVKSNSAVIGAIARASKGESVQINNIVAANNNINIFIDSPKEATGFVILYRFDKYPVDIGDIQSIREDINIKQYRADSVLVIKDLKQQNYYFTVFAEFKRDGEKDYSTGTNYLFANESKKVITYSISVTKKKFGFGENNVIIYFEAGEESFNLPDIDIYSAVGNVPMFKPSVKLFHSIPAQAFTGSLQVKIPFPDEIESDTYIKAFLKNDKLHSSYKLQLKINSSLKIR
ncbi:MAG: hypothetical protein K0A89_06070 [ANME-2 cluster archaeon]|nr:hypothetical protein [ANME-2 cluster archaeon]